MPGSETPRENQPGYNPRDVEKLLAEVPDRAEAILVGGQAINFWATYYVDQHPELREFQPFTSVDIDFFGGIALAGKWAKAIGAELVLPDPSDHMTINSAKLIIPQARAEPLEMDFLATVDGVDMRRAGESAIVVKSKDGDIEFRVLHPLHCLSSALANTYGHQRRRDHGEGLGTRARDRCTLAVLVCRVYLLEVIELYAVGADVERPYDLIEHIVHLATTSHGLAACEEDGIDLLDIVEQDDQRLSDDFRKRRWPEVQRHVVESRKRYRPGAVVRPRRPKM